MGRRRLRATPGLLGRVRWGNVGRLVALVAAVLLVVLGPPGGGGGSPPASRPRHDGPPVVGPGPRLRPPADVAPRKRRQLGRRSRPPRRPSRRPRRGRRRRAGHTGGKGRQRPEEFPEGRSRF